MDAHPGFAGLDRISWLLLLAIIVASPLLLGSNRPVFWIMNSLLAGGCLLAGAGSEWRDRARSQLGWRAPLLLAGGLSVSLLWMAIQAWAPIPGAAAHPVWNGEPGSISIAPALTLAAIAWAAPLAIFLAAFRPGTSRRRTHVTLQVMIAVAYSSAAFGLLAEAGDFATTGLTAKEYYQGWLTGTFVNRNTAACFFAIGGAVALALSLDFNPGAKRWKEAAPATLRSWIVSRNALFALAAGFLWLAVLLTGSRGGMIAAAGGSAAVLMAGLWRDAGTLRRAGLVAIPLILMALGAVALTQRGDTAVDSNITRLSLYREALAAIAERPLLGHGGGAFELVEPLYHSATTPSHFIWNNAHSSILELAVGNGLPAAFLVMAAYVALLVYLIVAAGRPGGARPAILAAIGGMTAAGLHSFIDFSLETQSVALYVAILAGLGMGEAAGRAVKTEAPPTTGVRWPAR